MQSSSQIVTSYKPTPKEPHLVTGADNAHMVYPVMPVYMAYGARYKEPNLYSMKGWILHLQMSECKISQMEDADTAQGQNIWWV